MHIDVVNDRKNSQPSEPGESPGQTAGGRPHRARVRSLPVVIILVFVSICFIALFFPPGWLPGWEFMSRGWESSAAECQLGAAYPAAGWGALCLQRPRKGCVGSSSPLSPPRGRSPPRCPPSADNGYPRGTLLAGAAAGLSLGSPWGNTSGVGLPENGHRM